MKRAMKREGIRLPRFTDKFAVLDWEAEPMPVLSLYPVPAPQPLAGLTLEVCGLEQPPRTITWEALASLPRLAITCPLICQIFNWSETVTWEGVRLVDVLEFLKLETHPEGYYAVYSRDGAFFETLSRDEAWDPRVLLAYGLNGSPLPVPHGGPLRLVVPFLQGYKSVKWVGAIRAFRYDPVGIKRLLGQSPTGQLNEEWRARCGITPPDGQAGDPPPERSDAPAMRPPSPSIIPSVPSVVAEMGETASIDRLQTIRGLGPDARTTLREVVAIVRPGKRLATRQALESAGVAGYTTYTVLGRSRQRGLRFPAAGHEIVDAEAAKTNEAVIQFVPKQLFSAVVEADRVDEVVAALIKVNRTGKGQYGDGRIFVVDVEEAVRISTDERAGAALR